jgi:phosphoribosylformimino-5-aminoimidazole carboxamide ribotide isomerase
MQVIPAIDLMDGRVVRLTKGDPETMKHYDAGSPLETARRWGEAGAELIHVVDLDAALHRGSNRAQILKIVESLDTETQVGGGIRDKDEAAQLLDAGVYRVVLGSYALSNPSEAAQLLCEYGSERVALALDHREGDVLARGWTQTAGRCLTEAIPAYKGLGFDWFLVTDVERDGALQGPDVETYRSIAGDASIIASGGVSRLDDLLRLRDAGAAAVVVGKALYEGRFTYRGAVSALGGR